MAYCNWDNTSRLNILYHDTEWGIPLHDDRGQFEFLTLEVMQCGLNWNMMIQKREIFRSCFDNFDFNLIADYTEDDILRILQSAGMIRSRHKIEAVINNAGCFKKICAEFGSFSKYIWSFSEEKTILYEHHDEGYIPASNGLSDIISRDLKRKGFKYVGPVTIYSHLQACGIINDHDKNCPRCKFITDNYPSIRKPRYHEKNIRYYGVNYSRCLTDTCC